MFFCKLAILMRFDLWTSILWIRWFIGCNVSPVYLSLQSFSSRCDKLSTLSFEQVFALSTFVNKGFWVFWGGFFGEDVQITWTADVIIEATLGHHQFVKVQGIWTNLGHSSKAIAKDSMEISAPAAGLSKCSPLLGIEGPFSSILCSGIFSAPWGHVC